MEFIEIRIRLPKRLSLWTVLIVLTVVAVGLVYYVIRERQRWQGWHKVTLVRRTNTGDNGKAAYSFLDVSHDVKLHRNSVDLIYDRRGLLHINSPGRDNCISDVGDTDPVSVTTVPKQGWKWTCIKPQTGHVYVLHVYDGTKRLFVKFRIDRVSNSAVDLQWAFLDEESASKFSTIQQPRVARSETNATNRICVGPHQES